MSKDLLGYDSLQEDAYIAHAFVDRINKKIIMITTRYIPVFLICMFYAIRNYCDYMLACRTTIEKL